MAAVDTFKKSSAIFPLCFPAWLRMRRINRPNKEPAEDVRIRRDFVMEMMDAHPEIFVHDESLREMMHCISRR